MPRMPKKKKRKYTRKVKRQPLAIGPKVTDIFVQALIPAVHDKKISFETVRDAFQLINSLPKKDKD